jgi:hypothetical protein
MINVEWLGQGDNLNRQPRHGWNFTSETDDRCRKVKNQLQCITWRQFTNWLAMEGPALRVWVNDKIVWHYERGWFIDVETYQP